MKSKDEFESWYTKENPWNFIGTLSDSVRRHIFRRHLSNIPNSSKVLSILDIGCGEGYMSAELLNMT